MNPLVRALGLLLGGSLAAAPSQTPVKPPDMTSAQSPIPADPADPWPDTLTLARGTVVRCRIVSASTEAIGIEYPGRGASPQRPMSRQVPWSDLRSAEFAMDPEFHRLTTARDPVKDTPRLAARWAALASLVGHPNHPAGELALSLARLSLAHPEISARHRALDACRLVAATDWNHSRRHHARLLQANLLAALGRSSDAVHEARLLAEDPVATPDAAMPALVLVARADFAALRKLEEENPKWADDDIVRPEREVLFHRALDSALKPSVFHGALEDPASQGLWTAVELLEFDHQIPAAAANARDLAALYPGSSRATDATAFLQRHRLPLNPATEPDEPPPPDPESANSAHTPTTTGGEPIVHRRPRYADTSPGAVPHSTPTASPSLIPPDP